MNYPVFIVPLSEEDGGGYAGVAPDLMGCMSDGETLKETAVNLADAISEWLDECERMGRKVPEPGSMGEKIMAKLKKRLDEVHTLSSDNKDLETQLEELNETVNELKALNLGWMGAYLGLGLKSAHNPKLEPA